MFYHYLALGISITGGIFGQLLLKSGALKSNTGILFFLDPKLIGGLFLYFLSALFYIFALKKIPLSVAFPSVSISYVVVAYLAHLIWNEPFGINQLLALSLIISGIIILNKF
ncbi:EamA family transporter [Dactylococcopsis salina]|uniref:EamA-like transporter family n=1 Tax=Dactylococcopsis salina (strain PCC 8305) TaxID=13035 RepID=K9Z157_DACS8|nr:EamA family transporter [Dactylococcopsis salina]AFZ52098.1 EamA-like transporter family [Dactylococcopsis salina PCC 8305]